VRRPRILKLFWYVGLTVLVLSLPTFSYLVPDVQLTQPPQAPLQSVYRWLSGSSNRGVNPEGHARQPSGFAPSSRRSSTPARPDARQAAFKGSQSASSARPTAPPGPRQRIDPRVPMEVAESAEQPIPAAGTVGQDIFGQAPGDPTWWAIQEGYQRAYSDLFGGNTGTGAYRPWFNPFGRWGNPQEGSDNGSTPPPPPPPSDPPQPPGGGEGPIVPPDDGEPPRQFNFLVLGSLDPGGNTRVFAAYRDDDGAFVLENSFRFSIFVGIHRPVLVFDHEERIVTGDLNRDGTLDFVSIRSGPLGTSLNVFDGSSGNSAGSLFLLRQQVEGLVLSDLQRDGIPEVALTVRDHSRLVIYNVISREFRPVKELVLPFNPGLVVDSPGEYLLSSGRLHAFDLSLNKKVTLVSDAKGGLLLNHLLPVPYTQRSVRLHMADGTIRDLMVLESPHRIAVLQKVGTEFRMMGSFDMATGSPLVFYGDYLGDRGRRFVVMP
jgi:hypothetical protein